MENCSERDETPSKEHNVSPKPIAGNSFTVSISSCSTDDTWKHVMEEAENKLKLIKAQREREEQQMSAERDSHRIDMIRLDLKIKEQDKQLQRLQKALNLI